MRHSSHHDIKIKCSILKISDINKEVIYLDQCFFYKLSVLCKSLSLCIFYFVTLWPFFFFLCAKLAIINPNIVNKV